MTLSNQSQIDLWQGRVGEKWAALQERLDAMLAPATAELRARAGLVEGRRLLDIGCGTGASLILWAEGGADVTGLDVSTPMLAVAARRTQGKVALVEADAATWRSGEPFDLAVSQFGVMFFEDPDAAFANIAANIRPGERLLFACWRAMSENAWVTTPTEAIRHLLPATPPAGPSGGSARPGPFALADRRRLESILDRAGFVDVTIEPFDFDVRLATDGGVDQAVDMLMRIGPTGAALAEADDDARQAAPALLKAARAPHARGGAVSLGGAIWFADAIRSR
jgi:SAM-dependent methyltransferase